MSPHDHHREAERPTFAAVHGGARGARDGMCPSP